VTKRTTTENSFEGRIEGQDIICFANDWDSDPLSKKHIMLRLARRNRILWVNSIGTRNPRASARDLRRAAGKLWQFARGHRQVSENIFVYSPLAVPFHGSHAARQVNKQWLSWSVRRACEELGFQDPITWTFLPSTADVAGTLGEKLILYHCVDEFSEFTGTDKPALLAMEQRLIQKSDVFIVSSGPLYEAKREYNPNTFLVTHGVDVQHFRKACDSDTRVPEELAALPRPVIGFFGLVADWVDLEMIRSLASSRPDWSFVLIGKLDTGTEAVRGLANVHLFGRRDYALLPAYCKGFSVAILPFAVNALTKAANPLKLREYLAAGLPVVATPIPEAERLRNLIRIGETREQFLEQIEGLLAEQRNGPQLWVSRAMDEESWDEKVAEIGRIVCRAKPLDEREEARLKLPADIQPLCSGSP
jgi:glycosyltransferase involved in cell wall biosynthesis